MPDNIIRNVLQWVTDTASTNKTAAEAARVGNVTTAQVKRQADAYTGARRITAEYNNELGELGATGSANLTILEQSMRDAAEDTERLRRTTQDTAEEYDELSQSARRAAKSVDSIPTTRGAARRNRLEDIDRFGSFGTQVSGALGGSDLGNAVGLIGDLGDGVSKFGIAGIAGAGALAAITLAQQEYNRVIEIGKSNLEGALNAQQIYYNAIQSLSSEQVQEDITARENTNVLLRERIATLEGAIESAFRQAQENLGDAAARAAEAAGQLPTAQLREELNNLKTELTANEQVVGLYRQGLEANRFAAQDAAASAEDLAELYRQLDQVTLDRVAAELAADNQTAEQRQKRLADIQREIDAYQALIDTGAVSEATVTDLQAKIGALTIEQEAYANTVKSTADALDLAAKKEEARELAAQEASDAATARNDQILEAMERESDARTKIKELEKKINETTTERAREVEEAQTKSADKVQDIEAKAADAREDIIETSQDRITKLLRDSGREQGQAVGERDADAFRLSRLRTKDAYDDQQLADKRRLEDITENAEEAVTVEQAAARERVRTIEQGADRTVAELRAQVSEQVLLAAQTRGAIQFVETNGALSVINIHGQMWTSLQGQAFTQGQQTVNAFAAGVQSALGGRAGGGPNYQTAPTLTATIGAAGGQAQFNRMWDSRFNQLANAARGGRVLIP